MIPIASTYENQFLSLNPIVIAMVAIKFDSRNLEQNCPPPSRKLLDSPQPTTNYIVELVNGHEKTKDSS